MRRTSAALLTLLAFLSTLAFVWSGLAKEQTPRPKPAQPAQGADATPPSPAKAEAASPTRDLFVFGDEAAARRSDATRDDRPGATPATSASPAPTPEATPAPRARLVGFLRTTAGPSAVLALDGAVEIARVREERRGYRLLALDEEAATVRLKTPEGDELELSVATPTSAAAAEGDAAAQP
jgi:hypothetical protein